MSPRLFALLFVPAAVLISCADKPTAPASRCLTPGDTVGLFTAIDSTRHVVQCVWLTADHGVCFDSPVRREALACTLGDTARW